MISVFYNNINYNIFFYFFIIIDELKDKFLIDNENQSEVPVYALKNFNSIPWRRVSIDLLLPRGLDRLGTHGACLGTKWTLIDKQCIKDIAAKKIKKKKKNSIIFF